MRRIIVAAALCAQWTLAAGGMIEARADQLDTILTAKTIRIGIDPASPPYSTRESDGRFVGSEVEVAELLAKDLRLALDLVSMTPTNRIPYLLTDKADVVISTLAITPERLRVIDFTKPYSAILTVVGAPKTAEIKALPDLVGKRIALVRGTTNDVALSKSALPGTNVIRLDDDATTITALLSGQADAYATAPAVLAALNRQNPAVPFEPKIILSTNLTGVGLRKGEPRLKARIDAWVAENVRNGKLNAIYRKYFITGLPDEVVQAAVN